MLETPDERITDDMLYVNILTLFRFSLCLQEPHPPVNWLNCLDWVKWAGVQQSELSGASWCCRKRIRPPGSGNLFTLRRSTSFRICSLQSCSSGRGGAETQTRNMTGDKPCNFTEKLPDKLIGSFRAKTSFILIPEQHPDSSSLTLWSTPA